MPAFYVILLALISLAALMVGVAIVDHHCSSKVDSCGLECGIPGSDDVNSPNPLRNRALQRNDSMPNYYAKVLTETTTPFRCNHIELESPAYELEGPSYELKMPTQTLLEKT